jgi:hypothetical protein
LSTEYLFPVLYFVHEGYLALTIIKTLHDTRTFAWLPREKVQAIWQEFRLGIAFIFLVI